MRASKRALAAALELVVSGVAVSLAPIAPAAAAAASADLRSRVSRILALLRSAVTCRCSFSSRAARFDPSPRLYATIAALVAFANAIAARGESPVALTVNSVL